MSKNKDNIERRVFAVNKREASAGTEKSRVIEGYAAVFNTPSEDLGGYREFIAPGAFTEALTTSDVRALFNHDNNLILGRSTAGTLELTQDDHGLKYRLDVPKTNFGDDFLHMVERGDISQSSFGFTIEEHSEKENDDGTWEVTVLKVKRLYDISPVTFPAYPAASVALKRSMDEARETGIKDEFDATASNLRASRLRDGTLKLYFEILN